jgi:hypothetical protein
MSVFLPSSMTAKNKPASMPAFSKKAGMRRLRRRNRAGRPSNF